MTLHTTSTYGWCHNPQHGPFDHRQETDCVDFISDADHTERLLREAEKHDRLATHTYPSGATTLEGHAVATSAPEAVAA